MQPVKYNETRANFNFKQADGTAWMAFFCVVMLDMALELSLFDSAYQDMASKFFEHFIMIADAMNAAGNGEGWFM